MLKQVFLTLTTVVTLCVAQGSLQGFENGQYYTISSVATGKYISAGSINFTRGASVQATEWSGNTNQKWLTLEAVPFLTATAPVARDVPTPRFYLVAQSQSWNWTVQMDNGAQNLTLKNLPALTEALTIDSLTGNLTTEVFDKASSSQQWIVEDAGEGRIFLRNLGNNQCIKNFDYKASNLLQKLVSFIRRLRKPQNKPVHNPLSTLDCNAKDVSEKWIAEQV